MPSESLGHDVNELLAHSSWVRALARNLLADDFLADDVVQDAWIATHGRGPRQTGRIRAWLAAIVANLARGQRRERARRALREQAYAMPERMPSAAEIVELEAERRRVVEAVLRLGEPYRETLLLRFWCDLDPSVIAKRLGIPSSTVRNRLRRALAQVRLELERERPGQTHRTLQILVALSSHSTPAGTLASAATSASLIGVLAMTAKLKLLTAVAVVGLAGAAGFVLRPDQPAEKPLDARAHHATEAAQDAATEPASARAPARQTLETEPDGERSRSGATSGRTAVQHGGTTTQGIVVLGAVTDGEGRAIDGATVTLINDRGEKRSTTTQDGLGFVLAHLAPGEWEVSCRVPQYRDAVRTVTLAQAQEQIDFTLEPALILGVRLVTPEGKPLLKELEKGTHAVSFLLRDCLFPIATSANPGATIPWIGAGERYGVARTLTPPSKYRPGCDWVLQCDTAPPLHVSLVLRDRVLTTQRVEEPASEVALVVAPADVTALATTVRLKVVDAANGQPIESATLAIANGRSSVSGKKASADGSLELTGEPFGMLTMWLHAKGYEQRFICSSPGPSSVLDLGTIELEPAALLSGRVISPSGNGCEAYLHVWPLEQLDPKLPMMTSIVFHCANADGTFDTQVGSGRQLLIVRPLNDNGIAARVVDVSADKPVHGLEIAVRPGVKVTIAPEFEGGTVLRILDADGLPLWAELGAREQRTANLSAGRYTLEAYSERGLLKTLPFVVGDQPLLVRIAP